MATEIWLDQFTLTPISIEQHHDQKSIYISQMFVCQNVPKSHSSNRHDPKLLLTVVLVL